MVDCHTRYFNLTYAHHLIYSHQSQDEDEDKDGKREWVFINPDGEQILRHAGDTIIPGAGTRWKHLHRKLPLTDEEKMEREEIDAEDFKD